MNKRPRKRQLYMAFFAMMTATYVVASAVMAQDGPNLRPRQPQIVQGFPKPPYPGLKTARDLAYGADPQQTLDVIWPEKAAIHPRTIVIFVHGGGWTGGDKHAKGDDLYENVVHWAANRGMVGVNINYRLADYKTGANLYPTQEKDLAAAVRWVKANARTYGGDPERIFLWGHSAGGAAVAGYISNPAFYGPSGPGVKGAFLLSAPVDPVLDEQSGHPVPYYGKTHEAFATSSALRTLLTSHVPLLLGYSSEENGPAPPQVIAARKALCSAGHCPALVITKGSHQGEMMAVDTADTTATDAFLAFMKRIR